MYLAIRFFKKLSICEHVFRCITAALQQIRLDEKTASFSCAKQLKYSETRIHKLTISLKNRNYIIL